MLAILDQSQKHYSWHKLTLAYQNLKNGVGYEQIIPNTRTLSCFLLIFRAVWVGRTVGKIQPSKTNMFHAGLIAIYVFILKDVLVFS